MDKKLTCTMCGCELDEWDINEDLHFEHFIGYGSSYDTNIFEARLCCKCFDRILDTILPMFRTNPLSEYDIVSEGDKCIAKRKDEKEP